MSFPCHQPVSWRIFRNESIECQNRRAAIAKSNATACRDRKQSPLWWDAQKNIDQIVPAEFIDPKEIDTTTYRYQVFARPPPIECPPRSLREVTDAPPPIRYNVKRVAMGKEFPQRRFECTVHRTKPQFVLQIKEDGSDCGGQDSSGNNNTGPARANGFAVSQARGDISTENNFRFRKNKPLKYSSSNLRLQDSLTEIKGTSEQLSWSTEHQYEKKAANSLNENNSRRCPSLPMSNTQHQQTKRLEPTVSLKPSSIVVSSDCGLKLPDTTINSRQVQGMLHEPLNVESHPAVSDGNAQDVPKTEGSYVHHPIGHDGNSRNGHTYSIIDRSSHKSASKTSNYCSSHERFGNQLENSCSKSTTSLKQSAPFRVASRVSSQLNPNEMNPQLLHNESTISSRSSSPCSISTVSSYRSTKKTHTNRYGEQDKKNTFKSTSYLERESVASLLSERKASSILASIAGRGKKQFSALKSASVPDSVASLLSNSNQNNINQYGISVMLSSPGAMQDIFSELVYSALPHNSLNLSMSEHNDIVSDKMHLDSFQTVKTSWPVSCSTASDTIQVYLDNDGATNYTCTNNNSSAVPQIARDRYILKCCPLKANKTQGYCDPEKQKMLCRFYGKRPDIETLGSQPFLLDEVVPIDPETWKVKSCEDPKNLQCTVLTSNCQTGRPLESSGGPLMVCEPKQPKPPPIGYGTYKIIGGVQRREEPYSNSVTNLKFSPDIEEYREFIKRCPNYTFGRYDRTNPLNEMLIPSNKSTTLLRASSTGPFAFTRMPKRKAPPLFKPIKNSSDLNWRLPASYVNK